MTGRPSRHLPWLAALLAPLLGGPAPPSGPPPEVVRVRVGPALVPGWFPAGTELRGLPADEFEALVHDARLGADRLARHRGPRLLRARHSARWDGGTLLGRSEFTFDPGNHGPGLLPLVPWTPAALDGPASLGSDSQGRVLLRVDPATTPETLEIPWELRARTGSEGRTFALGLPTLTPSTLVLDLPTHLVPTGPTGTRQGPTPAESSSGRQLWQFDGAAGSIDLRLRDGAAPATAAWVSGRTSLELDEATASWKADWTVTPGSPDGPRGLTVQLDPGLEPIDVNGPAVASFRVEPSPPDGPRLVIALRSVPALLTIRARVSAPALGRWTIPAARPLDALWTGGTTTLRLGPSRALDGCRDLAGRRIPPPAAATADPPAPGGLVLAFDAARPAAVAELTFAPPLAEPLAEVLGTLRVGHDAPRLDARLTWHAPPGRRSDLAVQIPPGWSVESVRTVPGDEPAAWQVTAAPTDGPSTLAIHPPAGQDPSAPLELAIVALGPAGRAPFALPRVRPLAARVADETWTAQVDPGLALRPTSASGLAWLDPAAASPANATAANPPPALSWRWTEPDGDGQVAREPSSPPFQAQSRTLARVEAGRLILDWRISLDGPGPLPRTLPLAMDGSFAVSPSWQVAGPEATPLAAQPLPPANREALGLPTDGSAWRLDLAGLAGPSVVLTAHLERPWTGEAPIPLLSLPAPLHARGTVLVAVDRTSRSSTTARGLLTLDAAVAWRSRPADLPGPAPGRPAHAFLADGAPGHLTLRTESLSRDPAPGLIREATLRTLDPNDDGPTRHHLSLAIEPAGAPELAFTLPAGATLESLRLDGRPHHPDPPRRRLAGHSPWPLAPRMHPDPGLPRPQFRFGSGPPRVAPVVNALPGPGLGTGPAPPVVGRWRGAVAGSGRPAAVSHLVDPPARPLAPARHSPFGPGLRGSGPRSQGGGHARQPRDPGGMAGGLGRRDDSPGGRPDGPGRRRLGTRLPGRSLPCQQHRRGPGPPGPRLAPVVRPPSDYDPRRGAAARPAARRRGRRPGA